MTAGAKTLVHPYVRDDGKGGVELVLPRAGGKADVKPLPEKAAAAMMRHLNGWFSRREHHAGK